METRTNNESNYLSTLINLQDQIEVYQDYSKPISILCTGRTKKEKEKEEGVMLRHQHNLKSLYSFQTVSTHADSRMGASQGCPVGVVS